MTLTNILLITSLISLLSNSLSKVLGFLISHYSAFPKLHACLCMPSIAAQRPTLRHLYPHSPQRALTSGSAFGFFRLVFRMCDTATPLQTHNHDRYFLPCRLRTTGYTTFSLAILRSKGSILTRKRFWIMRETSISSCTLIQSQCAARKALTV